MSDAGVEHRSDVQGQVAVFPAIRQPKLSALVAAAYIKLPCRAAEKVSAQRAGRRCRAHLGG